MSFLIETTRPNMRTLFPGEIILQLRAGSDDGGKHWNPDGVAILLQVTDYDKRPCQKAARKSGQWRLLHLNYEPVLVSIQPLSLTGGLTAVFLSEQYPGLVTLFGEELAAELNEHMLELLAGFPQDYRGLESDRLPAKWMRFKDLTTYNELIMDLWEHHCLWNPLTGTSVQPFDREAALRELLKAWIDEKCGTAAHLAYYAKHRPTDPDPKQDAYDTEVEDFKRLAAASQEILERQLASA